MVEPFILTQSGKKFPFLNPTGDDIDIKDIAFSLANQCRWNGHVPFFSVAEHSVAVAARLPPRLQLVGLLHDAAEAYLSDIPSPIKAYLPDYQQLEDKLQAAVYAKYNLSPTTEELAEVKAADTDATRTEACYLLPNKGRGFVPAMWQPQERFKPRSLVPAEAVQMFLHWFHELNNSSLESKLIVVGGV